MPFPAIMAEGGQVQQGLFLHSVKKTRRKDRENSRVTTQWNSNKGYAWAEQRQF